jgi:hypothetical protein
MMKHSSLILVAVLSLGCGARTTTVKPDAEPVAGKPEPRARKKVSPALVKGRPKQGVYVAQAKRAVRGDGTAGEAKKQPQVVQAAKPAVKENEGRVVKTVANKPAADGFSLPDDQGGKLLAALLAPHRQAPRVSSGHVTRPRHLPAPRSLERPEVPLPPNLSELPRPRLDAPNSPLRPRALSGAAPLTWYRDDPQTPQRRRLPDAARVRLPSSDVREPIALPTLGRAHPDRAPLADPSVEASTAAALAGTMPARTNPAPFVRLTLPDPFEHSRTVRLRTPPKEDAVPANTGSRKLN